MLDEDQQIGPYRLLRRLGGGAFGEVWLARHLDLNVERAVKIPIADECVRQLRKEGQIQFALDHPNIVHTHELNTWNDPPYFVMDYIDGENLRERLVRERRLPLQEALRILSDVLAALEAAHGHGVLHRDLKPENILLAADGTVKVSDFGIGKVQADTAQSLLLSHSVTTTDGKSISGTIEYMSPQQRRGEEPAAGDDLYALGIIACELLTGERPERGISVEELFEEAQLDAALARIVRKALARPHRRYQAAPEMSADIRRVAAGGSPLAPPPPLPRASERPSPRPTVAAPEDLMTNSIGMRLKLIPPGTFTMGCESDEASDDEKPAHQVTLTKPFYIGVCPVSQAEYERVIGSNPSPFKGPNRPVDKVSWDDAQAFCGKLSETEGVEYRLPTEAEWEYACRAGSTTEFCFGDDESRLGDYASFADKSGRETHDVGQKKPNAWGLYDVHGNVWEWCQDWFGDYPTGPETDPTGPTDGSRRVLRGGSWNISARYCRSASRGCDTPDGRYGIGGGFRVARPLS